MCIQRKEQSKAKKAAFKICHKYEFIFLIAFRIHFSLFCILIVVIALQNIHCTSWIYCTVQLNAPSNTHYRREKICEYMQGTSNLIILKQIFIWCSQCLFASAKEYKGAFVQRCKIWTRWWFGFVCWVFFCNRRETSILKERGMLFTMSNKPNHHKRFKKGFPITKYIV